MYRFPQQRTAHREFLLKTFRNQHKVSGAGCQRSRAPDIGVLCDRSEEGMIVASLCNPVFFLERICRSREITCAEIDLPAFVTPGKLDRKSTRLNSSHSCSS